MELLEGLLTRRSVRRYSDQPVSREDISDIIKYAMYAPSAKNCRPWHFIPTQRKEVMDGIMAVHPFSKMLQYAQWVVIVCGDKDAAASPEYMPVDCANATENLLLAAHAKGLGACWLGIYPRPERMNALHELLDMPENIVPVAAVSIGWPGRAYDEIPERFEPEKIHWNDRW